MFFDRGHCYGIAAIGRGLGYGRKIFSAAMNDFRATRAASSSGNRALVKDVSRRVLPADRVKKAGQSGLLCAGIPERMARRGDFRTSHSVREPDFLQLVSAMEACGPTTEHRVPTPLSRRHGGAKHE